MQKGVYECSFNVFEPPAIEMYREQVLQLLLRIFRVGQLYYDASVEQVSLNQFFNSVLEGGSDAAGRREAPVSPLSGTLRAGAARAGS